VLLIAAHHIIADLWSLAILLQELGELYKGSQDSLPALSFNYADYVRWQRTMLGAESDPESVAAQQIAYWRGELAGLPEVLDLPGGRPRPAVASMAGACSQR